MRDRTITMVPALLLVGLVRLTAGAATLSAQGANVTPIQKVIQMLGDMLAKGKEEKHQEEVRFSSLSQWCESTTNEKEKVIKDTADKIEQLIADITKAEADSERLGEEISELEGSIAGWTGESEEAAAVRKKENGEYQAQHTDYSESIDALQRAIAKLKSVSADVPQSESLLEVRALVEKKNLPKSARKALESFLQQGDSTSVQGPPEANAYEFQSGGVVDMLEKLRSRFIEERTVLQKEEMNRKHAHNMMQQKFTDDIKYAEGQRAEKVQNKAQRMQDAAEGKGDLAEAKESKEDDETYLRDTNAMCKQKSHDYEERQTLRAAELEAIQKAIEIISSPEVSGAGDKHLPASLLQTRATSLAQLRASRPSELQKRVASLLSERAASSKSNLLATVAARMQEDPFAKVKKMIKDLLVRLMEEANDEADHKGWCDEELKTNKMTRDEASAGVEQLTATVDELTALEAKLTEEISDLNDAIADLDKAMSEATDERTKEKATNTKTIEEAKTAQAAVTSAIKVLKEFYGKAATATSFVQQRQPEEDAPFAFDEPYQGMQGEKGGVMGMLEVIQSDFARLEAKTFSEEQENQQSYDSFMEDSQKDKAVKDKTMRHKGFKKTRTVRDLNQAKKDLKSTQEELDAALDYYEKLKPSCVDTGLSYEERVAKRKAEIQSLQEALEILNGEELSGKV